MRVLASRPSHDHVLNCGHHLSTSEPCSPCRSLVHNACVRRWVVVSSPVECVRSTPINYSAARTSCTYSIRRVSLRVENTHKLGRKFVIHKNVHSNHHCSWPVNVWFLGSLITISQYSYVRSGTHSSMPPPRPLRFDCLSTTVVSDVCRIDPSQLAGAGTHGAV